MHVDVGHRRLVVDTVAADMTIATESDKVVLSSISHNRANRLEIPLCQFVEEARGRETKRLNFKQTRHGKQVPTRFAHASIRRILHTVRTPLRQVGPDDGTSWPSDYQSIARMILTALPAQTWNTVRFASKLRCF